MFVYRVQTKANRGPYVDSYALTEFNVCKIKHPAPCKDGIDRANLRDNDLFAFRSVEQLEAWFDDEMIESLIKYGYLLYSYSVSSDHVQFGSKQVVFDIDKAIVENVYSFDKKHHNYYRHRITPGI